MAVTYIGEVMANPFGGIEQEAMYECLLKVALDLNTGKLGLWPSGTLHASMPYPHGRNPQFLTAFSQTRWRCGWNHYTIR